MARSAVEKRASLLAGSTGVTLGVRLNCVEEALSLRADEGLLVLFLRVGMKSERGYRWNIVNKRR